MGLICRLDMVKRRNRLQKTKERRERGGEKWRERKWEKCCSLRRRPETLKEVSACPEELIEMLWTNEKLRNVCWTLLFFSSTINILCLLHWKIIGFWTLCNCHCLSASSITHLKSVTFKHPNGLERWKKEKNEKNEKDENFLLNV